MNRRTHTHHQRRVKVKDDLLLCPAATRQDTKAQAQWTIPPSWLVPVGPPTHSSHRNAGELARAESPAGERGGGPGKISPATSRPMRRRCPRGIAPRPPPPIPLFLSPRLWSLQLAGTHTHSTGPFFYPSATGCYYILAHISSLTLKLFFE